MFTLARTAAAAAIGALAGMALHHHLRRRCGRNDWEWTTEPGAADYDVPPPGHPEALTATAEEFVQAMLLRETVFPGRPYIVDLTSWTESST